MEDSRWWVEDRRLWVDDRSWWVEDRRWWAEDSRWWLEDNMWLEVAGGGQQDVASGLTMSTLSGSSHPGTPEAATGTKTIALAVQEERVTVPSSFSCVVFAE